MHQEGIILPPINSEQEPIVTDNSASLQPVYNKVQQLKRKQLLKQEAEKKVRFVSIIEEVRNTQYTMNIDRREDFIRRKLRGIQTQIINNNNSGHEHRPASSLFGTTLKNMATLMKTNQNTTKRENTGKRSKSEKLIKFLKDNNTYQRERNETPAFEDSRANRQGRKEEDDERESFTPMRPMSKMSRMSKVQSFSGTSISKISGSQKHSSGGYSQVARLSNASKSNNSSTPSKYLRKGHRMRQTLLKQIQYDEDMDEEGELHYLKQYDQWVPAALANYKKLELEHFMNILVGNKKVQQKSEKSFKPIYL